MTFSYDPTLPNPPDDPADDVSQMQTNSASISSLVAVDHVGFNVANGGMHKQVTFPGNNIPSLPANFPVLFTNTQDGAGNNLPGGIAQPFVYTGTATQSKNQYVAQTSGSTMLLGGIIIKWGLFSPPFSNVAIPFPVAFPNNCFTVVPCPVGGIATFALKAPPTTSGFTVVYIGAPTAISYIAIGN